VSPSAAVNCATDSVRDCGSNAGASRPTLCWKPVAWLNGLTSQYSNHETFFDAGPVFVIVTWSSSSGSLPNGANVCWSTSTPSAATRLRK